MKKLYLGVTVLLFGIMLMVTGCKKTEYTVKFDTDGGTSVASVKVEKDKTVSKPTAPTKDGFKFDGWYLDNSSSEFDFNTKITKDITLKARWIASASKECTNTCKSGYKLNDKCECVKNSDDKKENPTSTTSTTTTTTKKASVTPTPQEPKTKYTVTFNSDGGSSVASKSVESGSKVTKPSNPTKPGYTFVAWLLDGSEFDFNSKITKNITLKAKWKEDEPVYTYQKVNVDGYMPGQVGVIIKKNGTDITSTVSYALDANNSNLGERQGAYIIMEDASVSKIKKVMIGSKIVSVQAQ